MTRKTASLLSTLGVLVLLCGAQARSSAFTMGYTLCYGSLYVGQSCVGIYLQSYQGATSSTSKFYWVGSGVNIQVGVGTATYTSPTGVVAKSSITYNGVPARVALTLVKPSTTYPKGAASIQVVNAATGATLYASPTLIPLYTSSISWIYY